MARFDVDRIEGTMRMIFFNGVIEFEVDNIEPEEYYEAYEACAQSNGNYTSDFIHVSESVTTISVRCSEDYDDDCVKINIANYMIADALYDAFQVLSDDYFNDDDNED